MDFQGKSAFVTGGASGIGLRCVEMLCAQGANVVAIDRVDSAARPRPLDSKGDFLYVRADVSDAAAVRLAVRECVDRHGSLDAAFNCAGISGERLCLMDQADDALDWLMAVNARGVFLSMKYELAAMAGQRRGAIVNVASVFSLRTNATFALYSATKHAVAGLTIGAAVEAAELGVRVNAVAPGPIRTPFIGKLNSEQEAQVAGAIPSGRLGEPGDVAKAMLWLASDESAYINGVVLPVDGAMSVQLNRGIRTISSFGV